MWLECTSQTAQAGYMGSFTGNRHALLITEAGGKMVTTPAYGWQENRVLRNIKAILGQSGQLHFDCDTRYRAEQQESVSKLINYLQKDQVKAYLGRHFELGTDEVASFAYEQQQNTMPIVKENLQINASNYAAITGKRIFIAPNILSKSGELLTASEDRKYDLDVDLEFSTIDSVGIEIPPGYIAEAIPQDLSLSGKFGNFRTALRITDNKL